MLYSNNCISVVFGFAWTAAGIGITGWEIMEYGGRMPWQGGHGTIGWIVVHIGTGGTEQI